MPIRTWIRSTMEDEGNFSRRLGVVPKGSGGGGQKVGRFFCVMTNGGAGAFKLAVRHSSAALSLVWLFQLSFSCSLFPAFPALTLHSDSDDLGVHRKILQRTFYRFHP